MVYLRISITQDLYDELTKQGPEAINDFGFDYLYKKGYIESDKEYKGTHIRKTNNRCEAICITQKYNY